MDQINKTPRRNRWTYPSRYRQAFARGALWLFLMDGLLCVVSLALCLVLADLVVFSYHIPIIIVFALSLIALVMGCTFGVTYTLLGHELLARHQGRSSGLNRAGRYLWAALYAGLPISLVLEWLPLGVEKVLWQVYARLPLGLLLLSSLCHGEVARREGWPRMAMGLILLQLLNLFALLLPILGLCNADSYWFVGYDQVGVLLLPVAALSLLHALALAMFRRRLLRSIRKAPLGDMARVFS